MSDALIVAMGMRRQLDEVEDSLEAWRAHAQKLEGNFNIMAARAKERADRIAELEAQLAQRELELKVEQMHTAGLEAQRNFIMSLKELAHTAFEPSGKIYADGDSKTKGRLAYEAAFDAMGLTLGIANPIAHRAN